MKTLNNTKTIPLLGVYIEPFCEYDYESIIKNFWLCSVTNRMNEFKFSSAFEALKQTIEQKLNEHGLCDYEDFKDYNEQLYDFSILEQFATQTNYISIDIEDIKNAVLKCKYKKSIEAFKNLGSFEILQDILKDIENHFGHSLEWKIKLFDSIIHAEHETGDIFDDVDIDSLRDEAEEEIKEILQLN